MKTLHLDIGGKRLELSYHGSIHEEGNIWIYAPSERILMVVDVTFPGWVPSGDSQCRRTSQADKGAGRRADVRFRRLDRRPNPRLGNRNDVLVQKQYMQDIMAFTEEIMNDPNMLTNAVNAIDAPRRPTHGPE